jgi:uncharacterized lipoprotein YmbA
MGTRRRSSEVRAPDLIALVLALIPAGCSSILAPRPDPTHFFILSAISPPADPTASAAASRPSGLVVGLGPLNFPDYLARAEMVTHMSGDRVEVSSSDRWAEPLDISFKRVLAHDLSIALGGAQVMIFPWLGGAPRFTYRIEMTIDRFDTDADGVARLDARWTIIDGGSSRVLDSSSSTLSVPASAGTDTTAAVGALNQAASQFAAQLATAILRLKSPT